MFVRVDFPIFTTLPMKIQRMKDANVRPETVLAIVQDTLEDHRMTFDSFPVYIELTDESIKD